MRMLRSMSIKARLLSLVIFTLISLAGLQVFNILEYRQTLINEKEKSLTLLIESTHTLVKTYYESVGKNGITEEIAKKNAFEAINGIRFEGDNYFYIMTPKAKLLLNPDNRKMDGMALEGFKDEVEERFLFVELADTAMANEAKGGFIYYYWPKPGQDEPAPKVGHTRLFKPWNWIIGSGFYIDDINAAAQEAIVRSLVILSLFALVIGTVIWGMGRSILAPLKELEEKMHDFAQGSGDLTSRLPTLGKDEITRISREFNAFVGNIQTIIKASNQAIEKTQAISSSISNSSQTAANEVALQKDQAASVSTSSHEMTATIADIAKNAESAANETQSASAAAQECHTKMTQATQSVRTLVEDINNNTQVLNQLAENSNKISEVLGVINGIAEQTNLLALNAAIEAARAGEQGRGFAVVADEVRNLANRTQQSTEEISITIAELQNSSNLAQSNMKKNHEHSTQVVEINESAAETVLKINREIEQVYELNTSIASAVEEQAAVTNEISQSVERMAKSTQTVNEISQQQNTYSQELTTNLQDLIKHTGKFRV